MTDGHPPEPSPATPWQQAVLDDVFLLTMFGLVVPTLFYIVWGLIELASLPLFKP